MYNGKAKFDRDQLVFVVRTIMIGAIDRAESCVPPTSPLSDWSGQGKTFDETFGSYIRGAMESTGMSLAVLYAQLTGDGLGIGDALAVVNFDEFINEFVASAILGEGRTLSPGDTCHPDVRPYAEKFVDKMFADYLNLAEQKPKTEPYIRAEVHSDDHQYMANFDARPWFEQASDGDIELLVDIDFGGDYAADAVAEFCQSHDQDVAAVFEFKEEQGFECNVSDADACRWIKVNRPQLFQKLASGRFSATVQTLAEEKQDDTPYYDVMWK
jgi:hypothetical protein